MTGPGTMAFPGGGRLRLLLAPLLFLGGCGDGGPQSDGSGAGAPEDPWVVAVRRYPLPLPTPGPHRELYDFGRARMLSRLVEKLSGATSKACFDHIRQLFGRIPADEAVPALEEAIQGLLVAGPETRPILQNTCEAAAFTRDRRLLPALMRAALVPPGPGQPGTHLGVQRAALEAIAACGKPEDGAALWAWFQGAGSLAAPDLRGRILLLRALLRIEGAAVAPRFEALLKGEPPNRHLEEEILTLCGELPPPVAAALLAPGFPRLKGAERLQAAKILHAAGDALGSNFLVAELERAQGPGQAALRALLVEALGRNTEERWLQETLRFMNDPSDEVRAAVAGAIGQARGEEALAALEVLASHPVDPVRRKALAALRERGRTAALDLLHEELRTASGSARRRLLEDLIAARDPRLAGLAAAALPISRGGERLQWLRILGILGHPEGVALVLAVLKEPREMLTPDVDSHTYAARMLANLPAAEAPLRDLVRGEAAGDETRRPLLLQALANLAGGDRAGGEARRRLLAFFMELAADEAVDPRDRIAIPRLVLPLLGLDEALRLKRLLPGVKEPHVRQGWNDFLWEFF